jgi:hypothetical protein
MIEAMSAEGMAFLYMFFYIQRFCRYNKKDVYPLEKIKNVLD